MQKIPEEYNRGHNRLYAVYLGYILIMTQQVVTGRSKGKILSPVSIMRKPVKEVVCAAANQIAE